VVYILSTQSYNRFDKGKRKKGKKGKIRIKRLNTNESFFIIYITYPFNITIKTEISAGFTPPIRDA